MIKPSQTNKNGVKINDMINGLPQNNYSQVESVSSNYIQKSMFNVNSVEQFISEILENKLDEGIAIF